MSLSLKTKISTPKFDECQKFYQTVFGMYVVEEWDSPDDKGVILAFQNGKEEAFIEIYFTSDKHDFGGLSLQFKSEELDEFVAALPDGIAYEGPKPRAWGSRYLYLQDPAGVLVIVYDGGN